MTSPLERARAVATGVAARHAEAVDAEERFPGEAVAALKEARILGAFVPRDLGGDGASMSEIVSICHLLGRSCGSTGLILAMHQIQTACIVHHGQRDAWHHDTLRRLAAEQLLLGSATTEAATGGDLGRSECAIVQEGDHFTLEKRGAVISYGDNADMILATARRSAEAQPSDQVLAVLPRDRFELTRTAEWRALGMRGTCSHTYLFRGGGEISQILPSPYGDIQNDTMTPFAHLTWAAVWLGIAVDAVSRARAYLRTGAGAEAARARFVEANALLQQMKANIAGATRDYEAVLARPDRTVPLSLLITMNNLKLSVSTGVVQVIQQALLICGIAGYRNDTPYSLGRHLRDASSAALMVGNDRIAAGMGKMLLMHRSDADLITAGENP